MPGLERTRSADLVAIPTWDTTDEAPDPEIVTDLHAAVDRGATLLGVCTGAFLLAAAGLLDGRRATTHWHHAVRLGARFPDIVLEPDRLYVEDGPIVTSAGTAAGIDACLHLVRREPGALSPTASPAAWWCRHTATAGKPNTSPPPSPRKPATAATSHSCWPRFRPHLDRPHSVDGLPRWVHMSPRTFARRFTATTGTAPHQWITRQRVHLAQRLLEEDALDVTEIARRRGFPAADALRHHFTQHLAPPPPTTAGPSATDSVPPDSPSPER